MKHFISKSPSETFKIGYKIGKSLNKPQVLALIGELGAGKTCIIKGIAKGFGVKEIITSPTFIIMKVYNGRLPLYHFDLYRIKNINELFNIGYEEYFYSDGICVVEWADKAENLLPDNTIIIKLKYINSNTREIIIAKVDKSATTN
ncbi:MAG: tRNA (adenosine(37)-N6)-threonylcarbamoyltransferase complex ATPase subunit type 1 TsaE [Candidatus Firestonebacteria bacterium]